MTIFPARPPSILAGVAGSLLWTLLATNAGAGTLAAFSFGADVAGQGASPDLVADGLAVGEMSLTQDGSTRGPLAYGDGSVGRAALTTGGWSPVGTDNFYETVLTVSNPGTTFQVTDLRFDQRSSASSGETLEIDMIVNGEPAITVYSRGGGSIAQWLGIDFCAPCFSPLGWPAVLQRDDVQSLVIRVRYAPVSTAATCGIDEFVLMGNVGFAVPVAGAPPRGREVWLGRNHPNPFNPRTSIPFSLGRPGRVRLQILDLRGRTVRTLLDESRPEGDGSVVWDGRDDLGRTAASGTYVYRIETREGVERRKMVLLQ